MHTHTHLRRPISGRSHSNRCLVVATLFSFLLLLFEISIFFGRNDLTEQFQSDFRAVASEVSRSWLLFHVIVSSSYLKKFQSIFSAISCHYSEQFLRNFRTIFEKKNPNQFDHYPGNINRVSQLRAVSVQLQSRFRAVSEQSPNGIELLKDETKEA